MHDQPYRRFLVNAYETTEWYNNTTDSFMPPNAPELCLCQHERSRKKHRHPGRTSLSIEQVDLEQPFRHFGPATTANPHNHPKIRTVPLGHGHDLRLNIRGNFELSKALQWGISLARVKGTSRKYWCFGDRATLLQSHRPKRNDWLYHITTS